MGRRVVEDLAFGSGLSVISAKVLAIGMRNGRNGALRLLQEVLYAYYLSDRCCMNPRQSVQDQAY